MLQSPPWTPAHDAALAELLRAWHRLDDLRIAGSLDFAARSEALLELQQARRVMRETRRQPILAA